MRLNSCSNRLRLVEDQADRQDEAVTALESRVADLEDRLQHLIRAVNASLAALAELGIVLAEANRPT